MKDDLKYIDELAKNKLIDVKINPVITWEHINIRLNLELAKKTGFGTLIMRQISSRLFSFWSSKVIIVAISSFVLIIGTVLFFNNNNKNGDDIKNKIKDIETNKLIEKYVKDTVNIDVKEEIQEEKQKENVHMKIPIRKKIIKHKTIIIKDTIVKTDTVFVEK